jgi:YD repeat-containing protein
MSFIDSKFYQRYTNVVTPYRSTLLQHARITASTFTSTPSILKETKVESVGSKSVTTYSSFNLWNGNATNVTTQHNGNISRSKNVYAFEVPQNSALHSKALSASNRNMLTQTAATYTYDVTSGVERPLSASIETWSDQWQAHAFSGSVYGDESNPVWRKHKYFVWQGPLSTDGAFASVANFNWAPGATQDPSWVEVGSTTRYDQYSRPLEAKDMNGLLSSVQYGYKGLNVITTSTAGFKEYAFSSFEDPADGDYFGGYIVRGVSRQKTFTGPFWADVAHNGWSYLELPANTVQTVADITAAFGVTRYVASVWIKKSGAPNSTLKIETTNGTIVSATATRSTLGATMAKDWIQLTASVPVQSNQGIRVSLSCPAGSSSPAFFDDLRIYPSNSPIKGYVYHPTRGLVTAIINENGMSSRFEYDAAGRLTKAWIEKEDVALPLAPPNNVREGGFKLQKEAQYQYARSTN